MITYTYAMNAYKAGEPAGSKGYQSRDECMKDLRSAILRSARLEESSIDLLAIRAMQDIEAGQAVGISVPGAGGLEVRFLQLKNPITMEA